VIYSIAAADLADWCRYLSAPSVKARTIGPSRTS